MFERSILVDSIEKPKRWTMLASIAVQGIFVGALVVVPLVFTEVLPAAAVRGVLTAPAPPPPPPPPAPEVVPAKPTKAKPTTCTTCAPRTIPKLPPKEEKRIEQPAAPPTLKGGGVTGGTGTGTGNDIIGGITTVATPPPPPPVKPEEKPKPAPNPTEPIRVGGRVQEANLIKKVTPLYPVLAKQAGVQGTVRFTAVIGRDGAIQQLQLQSGHPLLVSAAKDAVKQWQYRPTLLNGEPVEVITQIDVNFTLTR